MSETDVTFEAFGVTFAREVGVDRVEMTPLAGGGIHLKMFRDDATAERTYTDAELDQPWGDVAAEARKAWN
jgi:hypothetical protein